MGSTARKEAVTDTQEGVSRVLPVTMDTPVIRSVHAIQLKHVTGTGGIVPTAKMDSGT